MARFNPRALIQARRDQMVAQLDAAAASANVHATFREELQNEREELAKRRQAALEKEGLTVQQRRQAVAEAQRDSQQRLASVLPRSEAVRTDPRGQGSQLAGSSAQAINDLVEVLGPAGGAAGQPVDVGGRTTLNVGGGGGGGPQGTTVGDLGVNARDVIAGGRLGTDIQQTPEGQFVQRTREQAPLSFPVANLLNTLIGAARGGRPLVTRETVQERPDLRLAQLAEQRLRQQAVFTQRQAVLDEIQQEREFVFNGVRDLISRGVPGGLALPAMRALQLSDDATVNQILDKSTVREMKQAQIRSENALAEQRLTGAEENRAATEKLGLEAEALRLEALTPLDTLGGIPVPKDLTPSTVFSDFEKVFDSSGRVDSDHILQAQSAQRLLFRSGTSLFYNVKQKPEGLVDSLTSGAAGLLGLDPRQTLAVPTTQILTLLVQEGDTRLTPELRRRARQQLTATGAFTADGEDLVPVHYTDPLDPNADISRGLENLALRLTNASPEGVAAFLKQLEQQTGPQELQTFIQQGLRGGAR